MMRDNRVLGEGRWVDGVGWWVSDLVDLKLGGRAVLVGVVDLFDGWGLAACTDFGLVVFLKLLLAVVAPILEVVIVFHVWL
jgi:hypothetical protein